MMDINMRPQASTYILCVFFSLLLAVWCLKPSRAQEEEKNYSISLVKTAEIAQDIYEVGDKKVLAEEYIVQDGDHIWEILRQKGLLRRRNLSALLSVLKGLNKSLSNLDLVHPGEKIIIPLKIAPIAGAPSHEDSSRRKITPLAALKELDSEKYTVKPGDSLIRIAKGRYNIPPKDLHHEYLALVEKLNPSIKDLNIIHPGQIIRLPIYSPEIVRKPIGRAVSPTPGHKTLSPLAPALRQIFLEMGEEWVQTGEHFIPLKSGGQIDLEAKSFPIINVHTGLRVIVDLKSKLPDKMVRLIESSWESYRIVRLAEDYDLNTALDKILRVCNYPKILRRGEPIELKGDIALKITGDWVITISENPLDNRHGLVVINLTSPNTLNTPQLIKNYLAGLGIKVIEYPPGDEDTLENLEEAQKLGGDGDPSSLMATLLRVAGQSFSTRVEIPVYQSQNSGFKLTINADFLLNIKGRDAIIDMTGLDPEIISFLKEHRFLILSLAAEKKSLAMVEKTLEFLGVQSDAGPHSFMATSGDDSKNITLSMPGIVFFDPNGKAILATPLSLPDEIVTFLSLKGYQVFVLASRR
jgi:LysM repeat protein